MTAISAWLWVAVAPIAGSFLGVVIDRADAPRSIVMGRSQCPACGTRLSYRDLVPLLSWLSSSGRCRRCGVPVGWFYPAVELAATGVAVWGVCLSPVVPAWASVPLGWALLALAGTDFRTYRLPDFLTIPLVAAGLLANWRIDPAGLVGAAIGAGSGFVFIIALRGLYRLVRGREGIGLGDAKLLAAAGAWVSWPGLPSVVFLAALSGLIFAFFRNGRHGRISPSDRVPFGAFLSFGIWMVWLYGPLWIG